MKALIEHINGLKKKLNEPISPASIVFVRIVLSLVIPLEFLHYTYQSPFMDWYYLDVQHHIKYPGFLWVPELTGQGCRILLVVISSAYLFVALGLFYRIAASIAFISYSWLFLMERASTLNHWYLALIITFFLVIIPANRSFSLDVVRKPKIKVDAFPYWYLLVFLLQISIVYFFSGIAKMHWEWMNGTAMSIYLVEGSQNYPVITKSMLTSRGFILFATWITILAEVLAPFLLFSSRTRPITIGFYCLFHFMNFFLFNIGLFPIEMMLLTLLFLAPDWPLRVVRKFGWKKERMHTNSLMTVSSTHKWPKILLAIFIAHFALQVFLPLRRTIYHRETLWSEEGQLFAWRMFTAPKKCKMAVFIFDRRITDHFSVKLDNHFSRGQLLKTMTNPHMILQMAHILSDYYTDSLQTSEIEVHVKVETDLLKRGTTEFVNTQVDLSREPLQLVKPYTWILGPLPKQKGLLQN